jgi:hypothetical protein
MRGLRSTTEQLLTLRRRYLKIFRREQRGQILRPLVLKLTGVPPPRTSYSIKVGLQKQINSDIGNSQHHIIRSKNCPLLLRELLEPYCKWSRCHHQDRRDKRCHINRNEVFFDLDCMTWSRISGSLGSLV